MQVCMHTTNAHLATHIHTYIHRHIHACLPTYKHIHMYTYILTHRCLSMDPYLHTYITYIHWDLCMPNLDTHVCLHTCTAYIHIFQPRDIHNFRVKYIYSVHICIIAEFPDFKEYGNLIILEVKKFWKYGN